MKTNRMTAFGVVGMLLMALLVGAVSVNAVQERELTAEYNYGSAPVLDGMNTNGEYDGVTPGVYMNHHTINGDGYAYVYVLHDADYIYIYADDVYSNESFYDDWFGIRFDIDNDGYWNVTYEPTFGCYVEYSFAGEVEYIEAYNDYNEYHCRDYGGYWGLNDDNITGNYSVIGVDVNVSFGPSANSAVNHSQMEFKIPKTTSFYTMNETQVSFFGELYNSNLPNMTGAMYDSYVIWNGNVTFEKSANWGNLTFAPYNQFVEVTNLVLSVMVVLVTLMVFVYFIKVMFKSGKKVEK